MTELLKSVVLIALPASGKSEVRRYIEHLPPDRRARDLRMGPSVQLDDYPYVHLMRRIDDELVAAGKSRVYFHAADRPFRDPYQWGTLMELLNEDHADLVSKKKLNAPSAARHYFQRLDAAAKKCGARPLTPGLDEQCLTRITGKLEQETRKMLDEKQSSYPDTLQGKTLIIECARGGPAGAAMPLPEPLGYRYSLSRFSEEILRKTVILYIWVTPEESRRKNEARIDPNDPGSILHHGVPHEVMMKDYGCDDIEWLLDTSSRPGTATIQAHGKSFQVPVGRFDNRVDKTSFLRGDTSSWKPEDVRAVHEGLKEALNRL
ncbi:hypothetical protein HY522_03150 [bacterium]|nr:hypothetical protein [bacterium]